MNYHAQYEENRLKANPAIAPFFYDINKETAARAYYNTSHSPERAGSIVRSDYAIDLINAKEAVLKTIERAKNSGATVDEDYEETVESWFVGFRSGLKSKYLAYLSSHSNVMSSFITGPANFPTARNQKRSGWADTHYENINKFVYSSKKGILKEILPFGDGTEIRTNDPDAVDKVAAKIAKLEKSRDSMKAMNKAVRKFYKKKDKPEPGDGKYEKCIAAIVEFGYSEALAKKTIEPDYMGYVTPFASYQLTNTGAEIRRLKQRTKEVETVKAVEINDEFPGGETTTVSDGRIVIEFGYKPEEETRKVLKSNAFKWSPTRVAWVRKLTANAQASYERNIKPMLENK